MEKKSEIYDERKLSIKPKGIRRKKNEDENNWTFTENGVDKEERKKERKKERKNSF